MQRDFESGQQYLTAQMYECTLLFSKYRFFLGI